MAALLFDPDIDSTADVLAIRAKAIELAKQGVTLMSWGSQDTTSGKEFTLPVNVVLEATRVFLKRKDPLAYGRRVRRTTVEYR